MITWATSICTQHLWENFFFEWSQTRLHCKTAWRMQLLIYSHLWVMIHQPWDYIQHSGLYIKLHFQHFVPLKLFQMWLCMGCLGPGHYLFSKWAVDDWSWNDNIQGDVNNSWYDIFLRINIRFTHSITICHLCLRKPLYYLSCALKLMRHAGDW